jgi:EXS family
MDWGMMKNPTIAASALCPFSTSMPTSSSVFGYQSVPTRETVSSSVGEIVRSPIGRHPSSVILPLPSTILPGAISSTSTSVPNLYSCWYVLLRNRLRFGVGISVLILVTDIVLRFSWTLRFYVTLFPSNDAFVLFTQFLEVIRRALWNLLRVEWENLKQSGQHHQPTLNNGCIKPMTPASVSIQMSTCNNNNSNGDNAIIDEEAASFLRSNSSFGKLGKW